jgi:hypothetical protein
MKAMCSTQPFQISPVLNTRRTIDSAVSYTYVQLYQRQVVLTLRPVE